MPLHLQVALLNLGKMQIYTPENDLQPESGLSKEDDSLQRASFQVPCSVRSRVEQSRVENSSLIHWRNQPLLGPAARFYPKLVVDLIRLFQAGTGFETTAPCPCLNDPLF